MAAMPAKAIERRAHIASAGTLFFVCEFKRKLEGFPTWKTLIFRLLMRANRFASARLRLPTVIRYDGEGAFWTEYLGGFTDRELALRAIEQMRAQDPRRHFELTSDLPLNGVLPEATDRWVDQDFPGDYLRDFYRANEGPVLCPFKRTMCQPEEVTSTVQIEPLLAACAGVDAQINVAQ